MGDTRYTRAIARAAERLGGYEQLAARLRVPCEEVMRWAEGTVTPPPAAFIAVTDILLGDTVKLSRKTLLTGRDT